MPKIFSYTTVKKNLVEDGASRVNVRWLITKELGANHFAMRLFEIGPGGYAPLHVHNWEHEVFILDGEGVLFDGEKSEPFQTGDVVFVPTGEKHQFKNNGTNTLKIICLIPYLE